MALAGNVKLPVNVAPACNTMVSPGFALLRAVWKLPPALTTMVLPAGLKKVVSMVDCGKVGRAGTLQPRLGHKESKAMPNRQTLAVLAL